MSPEAPEGALPGVTTEWGREGGPLSAVRWLTEDVRFRVKHGEFGPLPVIVGLTIIWTFFQFQNSAFLTPRNMSNLVLQIAVTGVIAIGIVFVLLLGEIDLSVGSVAGLTSAVLGVLTVQMHWPWWAAILAMLAVGTAVGAFHGAWFAVFGVPSFIVTLAGLLGWQGVQLHVLGDTGTINVFDTRITAIANTFLPDIFGWILVVVVAGGFAGARVLELGRRRSAGLPAGLIYATVAKTLGILVVLVVVVAVLNAAGGVPTAGVILLGLVACAAWITTRTKLGRYIFAVGGNAEAARRAAISTRSIRISAFAIAGFFAAVGGLISVARLSAASTQTGGGTLLLEAIAAAVIGGTSLFGGRGTVWAALLGALVLGSVSNGLDLIGQPADVKLIVEGVILLLAVTVDALSRRGRASAGR